MALRQYEDEFNIMSYCEIMLDFVILSHCEIVIGGPHLLANILSSEFKKGDHYK